jgi:uncharacterized protein (UPF0210 family)
MKIRSITYFCHPGWPPDESKLRAAGEFLAAAQAAYQAAGYEVQTTRLATVSFAEMLGAQQIAATPRLAEQLSRLLPQIGVAYAALGPALPEVPASYAVIPEAIAASENIFFSGVMADSRRGLSLEAVNACARVIVRCAPLTPDGFANLRFAALANVPPGAPFFPAAYWDESEPAFAIATEAADLAVEAFRGAATLEEGRRALGTSLEQHGRRLAAVADSLACRFVGIDFSLAPFPDDRLSLGAAVEALGVPRVGLHGSLAAAALLTETVERARFPHAGFSGFMQPVLEDSVLARRAAEGTLTVKDALLYSAVCGTGLDTVPLPGDVSAEQIGALLLDLAALALRLDKPLTARLMPIPGKQAGDPTGFDFAFFANSRVMALQAEPLTGALGGGESLMLSACRARLPDS